MRGEAVSILPQYLMRLFQIDSNILLKTVEESSLGHYTFVMLDCVLCNGEKQTNQVLSFIVLLNNQSRPRHMAGKVCL